jgi:hypothetical protein
MRKVGIEAIRPKLHAAGSKYLDLFALRQASPPDLPERIFAEHFDAVGINTLGTLAKNYFVPALPRNRIGKNMTGNSRGPKHVEIVDFAEQVLDMLQIIAPCFVLDGEKILDDIAEALDSDAEGMERYLGAISQGAIVEFAGRGPAFEREVFEERATRPDVSRSHRERFAPLSPLLGIEFFKGRLSFLLLFFFATLEDL